MDPDRTVTFDPAEHPPMERQFMLSQLVVASDDFVVNVTTEVFRDRIETVAMEAPSDVDEYELAGWDPGAGHQGHITCHRRGSGPPRVRGAQGGRPRNAGKDLQ